MTLQHIEIHICETATDAARLGAAGLPRYDIEPSVCDSCNRRVGEVLNGNGESVAWKKLGVLLNGDDIAILCGTCLKPVDKALTVR